MDRARQLGEDGYDFRSQLRESLKRANERLAGLADRCSIALYKSFPTQAMCIIDSRAYFGIISARRKARDNPVIEMPVYQSGVREALLEHFQLVWDGQDSRLYSDNRRPSLLADYLGHEVMQRLVGDWP